MHRPIVQSFVLGQNSWRWPLDRSIWLFSQRLSGAIGTTGTPYIPWSVLWGKLSSVTSLGWMEAYMWLCLGIPVAVWHHWPSLTTWCVWPCPDWGELHWNQTQAQRISYFACLSYICQCWTPDHVLELPSKGWLCSGHGWPWFYQTQWCHLNTSSA